jgi:hypothetical protein
MQNYTYWDLGSNIHYELEAFCKERGLSLTYGGDKDQLVNLIISYLNSNDFVSQEDIAEMITEEKEGEYERGYEEGNSQREDDEHDSENWVSREQYNRMKGDLKNELRECMETYQRELKEEFRNGFIRGWKNGVDWVPPPADYPELQDY